MRLSHFFAALVISALAFAGVSRAAVLDFEFSSLTTGSHTGPVNLTVSGFTITATAYQAPSPSSTVIKSYVKNDAGDEKGLGINGTLDNEMTLNGTGSAIANFIQVNVASIKGLANGVIKAGSVTDGEEFDVWGSNTAGTLGTKLVSGSTADNTFITIPSWGTYSYISMSVTPRGQASCSDNVLLGGFEVTTVGAPVPLPMSVLSGLIGLGLVGLLALVRRNGATA